MIWHSVSNLKKLVLNFENISVVWYYKQNVRVYFNSKDSELKTLDWEQLWILRSMFDLFLLFLRSIKKSIKKIPKFNESEWCKQNLEQPIRSQKIWHFCASFNLRTLIYQNLVGISKKRGKERIKQKLKVSTLDIKIKLSVLRVFQFNSFNYSRVHNP